MSGRSACAEIELKKKELEAQAERDKTSLGGIFSNLVDNVTSWMNPESYQAKNQTEATILKIIRTSINQDRAININQTCSSGAAKAQTNEINNLTCAVCNGGVIYEEDEAGKKKFAGILPAENLKTLREMMGVDPCVISNITQVNQSETEQKCKMNAILTDVMKSQAETQAQAVVKALQEASGLLSSNQGNTFSCDDIDTKISQKDYLGYNASCASNISSSQSNSLQYCGKANNVIQQNIMKSIQECVNSNTITKEMSADASTKTKTDVEQDQKAEGLDLFASLGSLGAMLIPVIILIGILCILLIGSTLITK